MSKVPHLLDPADLQAALSAALSKGGDFAEVFVEKADTSAIEMEDGKVRSASVGDGLGAGIRVVFDYHTGFAYTEDLSREALIKAAKTAALIAKAKGKPAQELKSRNVPQRYPRTEDALRAPQEKKLALLKAGYKALKAFHPAVEKVRVVYADSERHITVANSRGLLVSDRQPMVRLSASVVARKGKVSRDGTTSYGGRFGFEFFNAHPPEQELLEAARTAVVNLDARPAPAGEMAVVVAPGWGGILLHESVGHGLEADFILKKSSNYTGQVGKKVASPLVTVVDDGTLPNQRGSIAIDDEGIPSQNKVLIENGVLKGYMYDLMSAWQLKKKSTGSGRRMSYKHLPMPRMSCTYMTAGQDAPEDIIKSTKKGVYARNFGGGQVDISNGNFVFTMSEAYLIENGKLTTPLDGATLIGNGPEILRKVDRVGNDSALDRGTGTCGKSGQSVPVNVGGPTLRIAGITVGGTST